MSVRTFEDIMLEPPMVAGNLPEAFISEETVSEPEQVKALLPHEVDPDVLIEQTNLNLQSVRKGAKDGIDNGAAMRHSMATVYTSLLGGYAQILDVVDLGDLGTRALAAAGAVELYMTFRNAWRAERAYTSPHGTYAIQALRSNRTTSRTKKGDTVLIVHPPTPAQEAEEKSIIYDKQRSVVLDALTHTEADAFIVPLAPEEPSERSVSLRHLAKRLKGVECKMSYPEGTRALFLNRRELQDLVAEEQVAKLPHLLRKKVSQLYPSATPVLLRTADVPADATDEQRTQIEGWYKQQRLDTLGRLLRAEFQSVNDDVTRERSDKLGPEKQELEMNVPTDITLETEDKGYVASYVKQHLTATTIGGSLGFTDAQGMVSDKRAISAIALLEIDRDKVKEISDRVKAGLYGRMELLALAWQAEGLEENFRVAEEQEGDESDPELYFRESVKIRSLMDALTSQTENSRFLKRLAVAGLAGTAVWLSNIVWTPPGTTASASSGEEPPTAFYVEAHGNTNVVCYYAQDVAYQLNGDSLQWEISLPEQQKPLTYPTEPATQDYLEISQFHRSEYRSDLVPLPSRQGYLLTAAEAVDEDGNRVPLGVVSGGDGITMAQLPEGEDDDIKVTTYLTPQPGTNYGTVYAQRPLELTGSHEAADNDILRYRIPAEEFGSFMVRQGVEYDSGGLLAHALEGAHAGNLADKLLSGNEQYANCDVTTDLMGLNQLVTDPERNMARISGYLISTDTEKQGKEYVVDGHAWMTTGYRKAGSPYIDATPYLVGRSRAEAGLDVTPQEMLASKWDKVNEDFTPKVGAGQKAPEQSSPWEPLTAVGAVAALGVGIRRRQWLRLHSGRALDKVREIFPLTLLTPQAFRNLVAEQVYADPNGQKPVEGQNFADLRRHIFEYEGVSDNSLPTEPLQKIVNRNSPVMRALLNAPERRAARNHAKRILRARQHQADKTARQKAKLAKRLGLTDADLADST